MDISPNRELELAIWRPLLALGIGGTRWRRKVPRDRTDGIQARNVGSQLPTGVIYLLVDTGFGHDLD